MLKSFLKLFSQGAASEAEQQQALMAFRLLKQDAIQSKLALGVEQRASIDRYVKEARKDTKDGGDATAPADPTKRKGHAALCRTALAVMASVERDNVLTAQQLETLRQICWKRLGVQAFADPRVLEALEATPEQKAAIGEALRTLPSGERREASEVPEAQAARRAQRKDSLQKILGILNEAQQAKWAELSGDTRRRRPRRPGAGRKAGGAGRGGARKRAGVRAARTEPRRTQD